MKIFKILNNLKYLIKKNHRKYVLLVFFGNQIGSFLEMVGLGLIPVIAIYIFNPEKLIQFLDEKNLSFLNFFFSNDNGFKFLLIILIAYFLFKNIFLILMVYFQRKIGIIIRNYNASKLYTKYLFSPYKIYLKKNPSKLIGIISQDTPNACSIIELSLLILRELFLIIFLVILLFSVDPYSFSLIFLIFFIFSLFFLFFGKKYTYKKGQVLQKNRLDNFKAINQTFESIKEIKILNKENYFYKKFLGLIKSQENQRLFLAMMNVVPRFFLEIITITIIVFIIIFSDFLGLDKDKTITTITFLAFASTRIIPAFKTINTSINSIVFHLPSLNIVINEMDEIDNFKFKENTKLDSINEVNQITLKKNIIIQNLSFKYDESHPPVLKNINLKINKGEKIGLTGYSGSGKTTFINCLLGLLNLENGTIKADGTEINKNFFSWRKNIGYVPQDIYLLDDSIKKNVAFGLDDKDISLDKVNDALKISNSLEFIENLPEGIDTKVGNRGISISGGQRQRIGIARALYNKPNLLILDESTNALDEITEKKLLDDIFYSIKESIIILIAHRLKSLKICDKILNLNNGNFKNNN